MNHKSKDFIGLLVSFFSFAVYFRKHHHPQRYHRERETERSNRVFIIRRFHVSSL